VSNVLLNKNINFNLSQEGDWMKVVKRSSRYKKMPYAHDMTSLEPDWLRALTNFIKYIATSTKSLNETGALCLELDLTSPSHRITR
jgi:hypothetical protein